MDRDVLLDAIGMVDDAFLTEEAVPAVRPVRRFAVLIAAAVALLAMTVTALAVSEDFREIIFSIFRIETQEVPPGPDSTLPDMTEDTTGTSQHPLREMGVVNIDGGVNVFYFSGTGYVYQTEGGFYTSERREDDLPPQDPAFWEITADGIVEVECHRVDFPFTHGGETFRIVIDYAVLNGKLCHRVWPQGLNEDPYGNGWNAVLLGNRTDVLLLSIPVNRIQDITHDYFLLDLATLETVPLLMASDWEEIIVDMCWFSEDLRYAIVYAWIPPTLETEILLRDMEQGSMLTMKELIGRDVYLAPYFLDNETLICWEKLDNDLIRENDRINVVRYHIPTGVRQLLVEDVPYSAYDSVQHSGYYSVYGMLEQGEGEYELIDLRTNERLRMSGLASQGMRTSEGPLSERIMISYYQTDGMNGQYTSLGLLDPDTGVLKVLERSPGECSEYFWGWLDENSIVLTSHEKNNDGTSGYSVYVYRFE